MAKETRGIEVNTTADVERDLRIPTGNIFHTPLAWPWADDDQQIGTWGVETDHRGSSCAAVEPLAGEASPVYPVTTLLGT